jgi:hypothetical protein
MSAPKTFALELPVGVPRTDDDVVDDGGLEDAVLEPERAACSCRSIFGNSGERAISVCARASITRADAADKSRLFSCAAWTSCDSSGLPKPRHQSALGQRGLGAADFPTKLCGTICGVNT